jgi:hypothetical protein
MISSFGPSSSSKSSSWFLTLASSFLSSSFLSSFSFVESMFRFKEFILLVSSFDSILLSLTSSLACKIFDSIYLPGPFLNSRYASCFGILGLLLYFSDF